MKKFFILGGLALGTLLAAKQLRAALGPANAISTSDPLEGDGTGVFDELLGLSARIQGTIGGGMRMSANGLEVLKREESFRAQVYADEAGHPSIGYGHKLLPGEQFSTIDPADAMALLIDDLGSAEDAVNGAVSVILAQGQFDALASFAYNVGNAAFRASTLLKKVNDQDPSAVNEFARWRYVTVNGQKILSEGLVSRRQMEANLYQGIYA
jgi:lysozyme